MFHSAYTLSEPDNVYQYIKSPEETLDLHCSPQTRSLICLFILRIYYFFKYAFTFVNLTDERLLVKAGFCFCKSYENIAVKQGSTKHEG